MLRVRFGREKLSRPCYQHEITLAARLAVGCIMLITRLTSNLDHVCNKSPLQGMWYGWIDVRPYGFRFVAAFNLKLDTRHSSKLYFMSATVSCLRLGAVAGGAAGRTRAARCSPYRTYQGDFA